MDDQLNRLLEITEERMSIENPSGDQLVSWMNEMSPILSYLTTKQVQYYKTWNHKMYMGTKGGASVASMKVICDDDVPELYQLRKIIAAHNNDLQIMRSELSYLKQERDSI